MADKSNKWADNVAGRYFVDEQCIDCDACRTEAPDNFTRNDEHGYSYVYKQPESPEEETRCKAALEACPVEAIGDDGN
ncbi:ferredoxin [bacterium]|jgi:ferredoxin|nr:ferredoxin [bacterium]